MNLIHKQLLSLSALFLIACGGGEYTPEVEGCTDPQADNYNPDATVSDGTCTYDGSGGETESPTDIYIEDVTVQSLNWSSLGQSSADFHYDIKAGGSWAYESAASCGYEVDTENSDLPADISCESADFPSANYSFSSTFEIEVLDYDGAGSSDIVGSCYFVPENYISGETGSTQLTINGDDNDLVISILLSWD